MKLTYFHLRGRAEAVRFILAVAGVEYEDKRIGFEEWPAIKPKTPWGQVPILELDDGTVIAQSATICRYLGRKYNLTGASELEAIKCDEYVDAINDIVPEWVKLAFKEKEPAKKAELRKHYMDVTCPDFFSKLDSKIKANGGTFLVGNTMTWADIYLATLIDGLEITCQGILREYPHVVKMKDMVWNHPKIKKWIEKRPAEDLLAMTNL